MKEETTDIGTDLAEGYAFLEESNRIAKRNFKKAMAVFFFMLMVLVSVCFCTYKFTQYFSDYISNVIIENQDIMPINNK